MRKRYKIVLNVEIDDPEQPFPAGGNYTNLNRIEGIVHALIGNFPWGSLPSQVSLDKVIDKGEIKQQ